MSWSHNINVIKMIKIYLHSATVLVTVGAPVEQPLNGQVDFRSAVIQGFPRHAADVLSDLLAAYLQVFRHVVHDLSSVVGCPFTPSL